MKNIFVENLTNTNGNKVANQFLIYEKTENGLYNVAFQSYKTQIFYIDFTTYNDTIIYIDVNAFNYSRTTSKYIKQAIYNLGFEHKEAVFESMKEACKEGYNRYNPVDRIEIKPI